MYITQSGDNEIILQLCTYIRQSHNYDCDIQTQAMRAPGLCAEATMHIECITIYIFCPLSVCFSHAMLCCMVLCSLVILTSELKIMDLI